MPAEYFITRAAADTLEPAYMVHGYEVAIPYNPLIRSACFCFYGKFYLDKTAGSSLIARFWSRKIDHVIWLVRLQYKIFIVESNRKIDIIFENTFYLGVLHNV